MKLDKLASKVVRVTIASVLMVLAHGPLFFGFSLLLYLAVEVPT